MNLLIGCLWPSVGKSWVKKAPAAPLKVITAWNWRAVSTGAALEAARRVATMVEMIETFILGFERIYQDEVLERIVFFFIERLWTV
jgi:hypothetical protein